MVPSNSTKAVNPHVSSTSVSSKRNSRFSRFLHKLGPRRRDASDLNFNGSAVAEGEAFDGSGAAAGDATIRAKLPSSMSPLSLVVDDDETRNRALEAAGGKNHVTVLGRKSPIIDRSFVSATEDDGADPDASIRPITPSSIAADSSLSAAQPVLDSSSAHAPNHSHAPSVASDSTYDSHDAYTFGSSSHASTKPTTIMSLDGGANRIAIAPIPIPGSMAQPSFSRRRETIAARNSVASVNSGSASPTHGRQSSGAMSLSPPQAGTAVTMTPAGVEESEKDMRYGSTVPRHTLPHPSQNPHPASIPPDNASMLTLASSGAAPSARAVYNQPPDEDASVRALAPSRRESAESLSSRWSAAILNGSIGGAPSIRPSSLLTVGTMGTGVVPVQSSGLKEELAISSSDDQASSEAMEQPATETTNVNGSLTQADKGTGIGGAATAPSNSTAAVEACYVR